MTSRKQKTIFWILLASQILLMFIFVFFRLVDYDEGLYLFYAQLVKAGNQPYVDFFYPQMPYLPYAYAPFSGLGFSSLYLGRMVSSFAGLLIGVLLFGLIYRMTKDRGTSLLLFFFYGFSGLTLNWHSVVKTAVFSDLFGFLSFCALVFCLNPLYSKKRLGLLLSGFFLGVAFNFRLIFLVILPLEIVTVFMFSKEKGLKERSGDAIMVICGAMLASFPSLYLFYRNPSAFVFGNVGYHLIWGNSVIRMSLLRRFFTLLKFILYPQNLLILFLGIWGTVTCLFQAIGRKYLNLEDKITLTAVSWFLILMLVCFFANPTQLQYYEQVLPYILICTIPIWKMVIEKFRGRKRRSLFVLTGYLVWILPFVWIFIFVSREKDKPVAMSALKSVVTIIKGISKPQDVVLSGWPGYAVLSGRETIAGSETWGGGVIPFLTDQQVREYKLMNDSDVKEIIQSQGASVIIKEDWFSPQIVNLIKSNYRLVGTTRFVDVYLAKNR
jgi:4-amino-4-deoxy-L-arabinose transferase-like glycosyltransferase